MKDLIDPGKLGDLLRFAANAEQQNAEQNAKLSTLTHLVERMKGIFTAVYVIGGGFLTIALALISWLVTTTIEHSDRLRGDEVRIERVVRDVEQSDAANAALREQVSQLRADLRAIDSSLTALGAQQEESRRELLNALRQRR